MKLVIAVKPSVAQSLARVIGADKRRDGNGRFGTYQCGIGQSIAKHFLETFLIQNINGFSCISDNLLCFQTLKFTMERRP